MSATLSPGFRVGHWTDAQAKTGCTVILPPANNVTAYDMRGASPGSRELASLDLERRLTEIHGLVLTGGSAFGLAAADGVVAWLEERGIGYQTPVGVIPIVPAAVILDLGHGRADVRPGPEQGRTACEAASETFTVGAVGAGTGATAGKWAGLSHRVPGGLGAATESLGDASVSALAVVNPVGDVLAENGSVIAGTTAPEPRSFMTPPDRAARLAGNTVLVALTTQATLDKRDVAWLAARGSDGVTVSVRPAHTRYDGDVTFAIAVPPQPGAPEPDLDVLGHLATRAVAAAIRAAAAQCSESEVR